jgi:hypothetical protein
MSPMTTRKAIVMCALGAAAVTGARPGAPATGPWSCPATHPIKGYVLAESGSRVYFVPADPFYDEASPERCYASEDEARGDGARPAGTPAARWPSADLTPGQEGART